MQINFKSMLQKIIQEIELKIFNIHSIIILNNFLKKILSFNFFLSMNFFFVFVPSILFLS